MIERPRRLRVSTQMRKLVSETKLDKAKLIYPLFVVEGEQIKQEVTSMPDVYHYSLDKLRDEIMEIKALGLSGVLLFGIPNQKDAYGSEAYLKDGIVQRAIRLIKQLAPELLVITDVCMCEYTDHGHCGILNQQGEVDNDKTLPYLCKIAVSHAMAGADSVAPSDMMDGRIGAIRQALDENQFQNVSIIAYSAKYASYFYGPFREAAQSAPRFGDRRSYQMDPANSNEALKEGILDDLEGADMLMVKPALSYLDIIYRFKQQFHKPIVAYNVSGEYAMLKLAIKAGLLDEKVIEESLLSIKRAGADIIITYFAKYLAKQL